MCNPEVNRVRFIRLWPAIAGLLFACALTALLQVVPAQAITRSVIHSSVSDFNPGTFYRTGLSQQNDGEVTLLTIGIAGPWITTTNATNFVPRSEHAAIAALNRIYVFGGRTANSTLTSIQYATVNTLTHNLSDWVTATSSLGGIYPNGISALSAATLNGYVYLIGGYSSDESTSITSTVAYASLQSDGSLAAFGKTAPLPQPLSRSEAVVLNGYVYVVGGRAPDSAGRNTVYYAQPDPATGSIAQWLTSTASLPYRAFGHEAFAANGYLYVAGGVSNTAGTGGVVPSVYYAAPLTGTGDITAGGWISAEVVPFPLYEAGGATFGGQLYSTGGSASAFLAGAPSDYVGAAIPLDTGSIVTWVNTSLIYPARFAHAAVVDSDGWIYLIGGTVGSNQPITASIINAGATAGTGEAAYARSGRYTAPIVDLKRNFTLQHFKWTTDLGDTSSVSLTMRYRYRTATGSWSDWSESLPSLNVNGVATTSYPVTHTARYFQYEATFSSTDGLATPVLSRVEVLYESPEPPDFFKLASPPNGESVQTGDRITYTLRFTNTAATTIHNIVISDRIPYSTTYVAGTIFASSGVTASASGNPLLTWQIDELPPQTGKEVGYVVTVDAGVPEGTQIRNFADLTSDEVDARSTTVVHTLGTPPAVIKSAITSAPGQAGASVQPGDRITYTLAYSNPSAVRTLSGVVITDQLPPHLTYAGWFGPIAPDTSLLASNRIVRWVIGSIAPLGKGTVGLVATVDNTAPNGTWISNTVQIDSNETAAFNSNTHSLPVRYRFDLTLSMTDGQTTARAGERLTYTLRITNTSSYPVTATGVTIVDYLEPGLPGLTSTVLSFAGGAPGWNFAGTDEGYTMYEYAVGALGPNQSRTITMAVQVINPLPAGVLAVRNSAEIVDDGAGGVESDPTNQTASDTDIVAGADLAITGLSLLSQAGQQATVIVTVTNQGVDTTLGPDGVGWFGTDLYVKPAGSSAPLGPQDRYLGACPTATNYCPNDIRWSLYQITNPHGGAGLAPGESWVLTYTTALPAGNEFWLYAQTDTFWGEKGDPDPTMYGSSQHGRLVEADEANNISGVLIVRTGSRVFLPLVVKNR